MEKRGIRQDTKDMNSIWYECVRNICEENQNKTKQPKKLRPANISSLLKR
jgi:hypothetical protein